MPGPLHRELEVASHLVAELVVAGPLDPTGVDDDLRVESTARQLHEGEGVGRDLDVGALERVDDLRPALNGDVEVALGGAQ